MAPVDGDVDVEMRADDAAVRFLAVKPVVRSRGRSAALDHVGVVVPGGAINAGLGYVRGHGTRVDESAVLRSTLSGVIERVNKLVAVRALKCRYNPQVGDVVVGRITVVKPKRWNLDIGSTAEASLLLSAVTLPGGFQRRRNTQDELNMRKYFQEGDLISAEVQELSKHDGSAALHTRSLRYGKLNNGSLVVVQAALVQRAKKHFHTLECGVRIILGNNGYIFLDYPLDSKNTDPAAETGKTAFHRNEIARVANAINALDAQFVAISPKTIRAVYQSSVENQVKVVDMLRDDVARDICADAKELREVA